MARFLLDGGITFAVFMPFAFITQAVLWRVRSKGMYTILLALFFMIVFEWLGLVLVPGAIMFHRTIGMPPVIRGLAFGCGMPMMSMLLYHRAERKKRKQVS